MNLLTEKWQKMPDLNVGRYTHSSLGLGRQVYVACGWGADNFLASVEILRHGAQEWDLIEIPDLEVRTHIILSQVDA